MQLTKAAESRNQLLFDTATYLLTIISPILQVKFAQSGEDVLFSVVCKDFFNNSRTCLLNVKEIIAIGSNAIHIAGMQHVSLYNSLQASQHHSITAYRVCDILTL